MNMNYGNQKTKSVMKAKLRNCFIDVKIGFDCKESYQIFVWVNKNFKKMLVGYNACLLFSLEIKIKG